MSLFKPKGPRLGDWRIEFNPHTSEFYAQRLEPIPITGVGKYWKGYQSCPTEPEAREWIRLEMSRPIIVAEFRR
jgi:hypothetical protein